MTISLMYSIYISHIYYVLLFSSPLTPIEPFKRHHFNILHISPTLGGHISDILPIGYLHYDS